MSNQPAQPQQVQTVPAQPAQPAQPQQVQTVPAQPAQPAQPQQTQAVPAQPAQPVQPVQLAQPMQGGFNVGNMPIDDANAVLQNVQGYESIIAQQQAQINALINANNSLNQQVTQMVQNGAQFYQPAQPQQPAQPVQPMQPMQTAQQVAQSMYGGFNAPALSDNADYSLESLAKDIGKRDLSKPE